MSLPLSELYLSCLTSFHTLLCAARSPKRDIGDQLPSRDVDSELDKFVLWAKNVGIMHSGKLYELSLDYRLRESPFYRERVSSFLNTLNKNVRELCNSYCPVSKVAEYLSRATKIALNEEKLFENLSDTDQSVETDSSSSSESDSSSDTDEDEEQTQQSAQSLKVATKPVEHHALELPKMLEIIRFLITCLYKMPIRRPAALERLKSRLSDTFAAYQRFDVLFVRDLHPELDMTIATRLGRLISLRRQIIEYREAHNERMQPIFDTQEQSPGPVPQAPEAEPEATDVKEAVNATVLHIKDPKTSLPSKATTHRNTLDHPEFTNFVYPPSVAPSETSRASSYAVDKIKIGIPPMPKDSNGMSLTHFVCPYCSIAMTMKSERLWKRHVLADLKPYVCSFSGCSFQGHFFANRNEWYQHETQEHRLVWHCNVEDHDRFNTQNNFLDHMSQKHGIAFLPDQVPSIAPMFRCSDRNSEGRCNMCFRHSKNLRSHVARHLERLALFALPRWYNEEVNSQSSEREGSRKAPSSGDEQDAAPGTDLAENHVSVSDSASSATVRDVDAHTLEEESSLVEIQENHVPDSDDISWDSVTKKFSQARLADRGNEPPGFNIRLNLSLAPTEEEKQLAKEFASQWRPAGQTNQTALLRRVREARLDAFEDCIESIAQATVAQATVAPATTDNPTARNGQTLYLRGRPGWGKTTLIKHLSTVNMLRRAVSQRYSDASSLNFSETRLVVAAYYFDDDSSTYRGFLESLLHQILRQCPTLLSQIGYSREHGMDKVEYEKAMLHALETLQDAAVWILLDGIDEVDSYVTSPVFKFFGELRLGRPNLTICVTGTEDLPGCLEEMEHKTVELADRRVDLKNFMIGSNNTDIHVGDVSQAESIIIWADGLFLPARILFDLVQTQNSSITLRTVPRPFSTPNEFYKDVFQSFDKRSQERAARIILLMLVVERPRFLTLAARYLGKRDDADGRLQRSDYLFKMDEHEASECMRELCPFVHVYQCDKHLEVRFIHSIIPGYLKSTTGKALLQSYILRDDNNEYHYHVDMCEALLAEMAVDPQIQKVALSGLANWMGKMDSGYGLDLQDWDLLNCLRDTLKPYQDPAESDVTNFTHPDFWRYFPVRNNLVGLVGRHAVKLGNSKLLAWHLGITSHGNQHFNTDMVVALLESGVDVNAVGDGTERCLWHAYLAAIRKGKQHIDRSFHTVQAMIRYGAQLEGHIEGEEPDKKVAVRSILQDLFSGRDDFRKDQPHGSTRFLVLEMIADEWTKLQIDQESHEQLLSTGGLKKGKLRRVLDRIRPDPGSLQPRDGG